MSQPTKGKVIPLTTKGQDRVLIAEQTVLGSLLFEPKALPIVEGIILAEDFASPAHAIIFQGIQDVREIENNFDLVMVTEYLGRIGKLDAAGGPGYITTLCDNIGSAKQAEYYAKVIREASVSRHYAETCKLIDKEAEQLLTGNTRLHDLLSKHEAELYAISKDYYKSNELYTVGDVVSQELTRLEGVATNGQKSTWVRSGLTDLDRIIHSFQPCELTYLAARPGVGKTGLALNIANNCNEPVGFFSLEMSSSELAKRQLSLISGIDGYAIKTLRLTGEQWAGFYFF